MGRSGGESGSNRYNQGTSETHLRGRAGSQSFSDEDMVSLLGRDIHAVSHPYLDADRLEESCASITAHGVERGLTRWQARLPNLIWNDAVLEGNLFTLPDVTTVLDGGSPAGYAEHDLDQIVDLSEAATLVSTLTRQGPQEPTDDLSSALNRLIVAHEVIEPGVLRGEGKITDGKVTVNVLGDVFWPTESGTSLRQAFTEAIESVSTIYHPVARATAWAAFGAYHQFYSNGNKRTARYVMNTVLLSHGYNAILTPANRRAEYNQSLRDMYVTGDITGHAAFLVSLYDDSRTAPGI